MLDVLPPPLWVPAKPAIIRPAEGIIRPAPDGKIDRAMLPGMVPIVGRKLPPATLSWSNVYTYNSSSTTTYDFASVNIGSDHASRRVYVAAQGVAFSTASCTIDPSGANVAMTARTANGTIIRFWEAAFPTGTSPTIRVTSGSSGTVALIAVWYAVDTVGTATDWANGNNSGTTTPLTLSGAQSIDTLAGGFFMGFGAAIVVTATFDMTWGGPESVNTRYQSTVDSNSYVAADVSCAVATSGQSVSFHKNGASATLRVMYMAAR